MMTPAVVRFTLTQPDGRVAVLRFAKALIRIGRALDNDVVCEAPEVSARHAELHVVDRRLTLVDLGSRQGLWLGPTRLPAGLGVDFTAGSTVQLGPLRLCIELDDEGGMTTASTERERRLRITANSAPARTTSPTRTLLPFTSCQASSGTSTR